MAKRCYYAVFSAQKFPGLRVRYRMQYCYPTYCTDSVTPLLCNVYVSWSVDKETPNCIPYASAVKQPTLKSSGLHSVVSNTGESLQMAD